MEFTAITTQEQLNEVIREQLEREREAVKKNYEGYLSPEEVEKKLNGFVSKEEVEKQYRGYLSPEEAAKKDREIKEYKIASIKAKVAHEIGLPYELSGRLSGEDEDAIRKDAESFFKAVGKKRAGTLPPLANREVGADDKDAALREMVRNLNKKGE